jgi:hypothetical protein
VTGDTQAASRPAHGPSPNPSPSPEPTAAAGVAALLTGANMMPSQLDS